MSLNFYYNFWSYVVLFEKKAFCGCPVHMQSWFLYLQNNYIWYKYFCLMWTSLTKNIFWTFFYTEIMSALWKYRTRPSSIKNKSPSGFVSITSTYLTFSKKYHVHHSCSDLPFLRLRFWWMVFWDHLLQSSLAIYYWHGISIKKHWQV